MDIAVELTQSDEKIARLILEEIRNHIKTQFSQLRSKIEEAVKNYIGISIRNSSFYNNLMNSKLRTELGVRDPDLAMTLIIDALKSTVVVTPGDVKIYNNAGIKANIIIKAVPDDFQAALSTPLAQYVSENGQLVPWLSWVLFEGTSPVVLDYELIYGQPIFSRTGDAVMRISPGSKWRVPSQFAGTIRNNFITEALNSNITQLEQILDGIM